MAIDLLPVYSAVIEFIVWQLGFKGFKKRPWCVVNFVYACVRRRTHEALRLMLAWFIYSREILNTKRYYHKWSLGVCRQSCAFLSTKIRCKFLFTSFTAAAPKKYSSSCVCSQLAHNSVSFVDMGTTRTKYMFHTHLKNTPHLSVQKLIRDN